MLDRGRVIDLLCTGEHLDAAHAREIIASGDAVAPFLIELMLDDELAAEGARGEGYAPVHAARLLGELRAESAIEAMLRRLRDTDWNDLLHNALLVSLPRIGAAVVEPALRAYERSEQPYFRSIVASVLSETCVRDERIFELLVQRLSIEPDAAAMCLASYGDPRAVAHLGRAFDEFRLERGEHLMSNQALIELRAAIEKLGGVLTPEQEAKSSVAIDARMTWRNNASSRAETTIRRERPGRNDACWCGSAKKYKRCHLDDDVDAARAAHDLE